MIIIYDTPSFCFRVVEEYKHSRPKFGNFGQREAIYLKKAF
jgi:hypothetical protein